MDRFSKIAAWGLGGVAVFSSMHVADELWSRWDVGESSVSSSFEAGLFIAVPTIITLVAFAGMLLRHRWGFGVAAIFGVFALWPPLTHVLDTHEMTAFRWSVEAFAVVSAITLIAASVAEYRALSGAVQRRPMGRSILGH